MLKTTRIRKIKKELKQSRVSITHQSKRIEQELKIQLLDILREELSINDSLQVEVEDKYLGYFINILNDKDVSLYDYDQQSKTCFNFYPKDILTM